MEAKETKETCSYHRLPLLPQAEFLVRLPYASQRTYLTVPSDKEQQHCLSLSCTSLNQFQAPVKPPENLSKTRADKKLAKHFLMRLFAADDKKKLGIKADVFAHAAMFQFYLDFHALATSADDEESQPGFPAHPGNFKQVGRNSVKNWRSSEKVMMDLTQDYWATHPLLRCVTSETEGSKLVFAYGEDVGKWKLVAEVIRRAQVADSTKRKESEKRKDLLVFFEAMDTCVFRLDDLHSEFSDRARELSKKKICNLL